MEGPRDRLHITLYLTKRAQKVILIAGVIVIDTNLSFYIMPLPETVTFTLTPEHPELSPILAPQIHIDRSPHALFIFS